MSLCYPYTTILVVVFWVLLRVGTSLSTGAAIEISGVWKACPPGKEQTHELQTTEVKIVGEANPEVRVHL